MPNTYQALGMIVREITETAMANFELTGPYDIHRDGVPESATTTPTGSPSPYTPMLIELVEQREGLIVYLLGKVKTGDWHAIADAAMDLREVDAQIALLKDLRG